MRSRARYRFFSYGDAMLLERARQCRLTPKRRQRQIESVAARRHRRRRIVSNLQHICDGNRAVCLTIGLAVTARKRYSWRHLNSLRKSASRSCRRADFRDSMKNLASCCAVTASRVRRRSSPRPRLPRRRCRARRRPVEQATSTETAADFNARDRRSHVSPRSTRQRIGPALRR